MIEISQGLTNDFNDFLDFVKNTAIGGETQSEIIRNINGFKT